MPKFYCIDNGLRNAVVMPLSGDNGKLLENAVYLHLKRTLKYGEKISYYKSSKPKCDFVIQTDETVTRLIQVTWSMQGESDESKSTRKREFEGLVEAHKLTGCKDLTIVTSDEDGAETYEGLSVRIVKGEEWVK